MISFLTATAVAIMLSAMQASIEVPRKNFGACLSSALDAAMAQKIAVPDYEAFVRTTCQAQADSLKAGLVGFDVKNGIKRSQAVADAQAQIDDYLVMAAERYESRSSRLKATATPAAVAPPPTPVAAPKQ